MVAPAPQATRTETPPPSRPDPAVVAHYYARARRMNPTADEAELYGLACSIAAKEARGGR